MNEIRIESIAAPFVDSPRATDLGLRLLSCGQVMGFFDAGGRRHLDAELLRDLGQALGTAGIARDAVARLPRARGEELERVLGEALAAVEDSPQPAGEWAPARELLGDELLAQLAGVSPSSLRRYAAGARGTPDEVAWRLHVVARILAGLTGSYNAYGVRRWFERPRSTLQGRTPAEVIAAAKTEDDPDLGETIALAEALAGAGSAA